MAMIESELGKAFDSAVRRKAMAVHWYGDGAGVICGQSQVLGAACAFG